MLLFVFTVFWCYEYKSIDSIREEYSSTEPRLFSIQSLCEPTAQLPVSGYGDKGTITTPLEGKIFTFMINHDPSFKTLIFNSVRII